MSRPVSSEGQDQTTVPDRHRPARLQTDNPHLIALLRRPDSIEPTAEADAADKLKPIIEPGDKDDPLAAARGLAIGTLGDADVGRHRILRLASVVTTSTFAL